jgi:hypothetical protein
MISIDPLVVFVVGTYLYYRPLAKQTQISGLVTPGKYPGHLEELLDRGHQWFEDPLFFLRRQ